SFAGTVTASSPQQISLIADDNRTTRTIDMKDVRTIEYSDQTAAPPPAAGTPADDAAQVQDHSEHHPHPVESAIRTRSFVVPAGGHIPVRTEETIDSARASEGQTYPAEVARDVLDADGQVVIPRGSNATIVIRSASRGGHFHGASDLVLDLESVSVDGRRYQLSTADLVQKGKDGVGGNRRTAKYVGGGAVVGTIIGAIAGHGKGAAIGAASGAGAGAAGELLTKGHSIRIPVESLLTFRLDQPLRVSAH
ncbi:MAG TPA: hypothetical protein VGV35_19800, partial [Bryobacteraceae bacterium]|nr:hypothetical protein [Bryobacteraceae bacterium]